MCILDFIDSWVEQTKADTPQKRRQQKIGLYAEGLKAKILQVDYCLIKLSELKSKSDRISRSTSGGEKEITERVLFYSDTFWTFLFSSLDILAQIINQALKLNMDERKASFKTMRESIAQQQRGAEIQKKLDECFKARSFKNLEKYRNCSIHRRAIFIKGEVKLVWHTPGYQTATTMKVPSVIRTLCDDPYDLTPKTTQKRTIPDYMIKTRDNILEHIIKILEKTKTIK